MNTKFYSLLTWQGYEPTSNVLITELYPLDCWLVKYRGTAQFCTMHLQYSLCSLFLCWGKWTSDGVSTVLAPNMQCVMSSLHSNCESPLLQSMFQSAKMFRNVIAKFLPTPFQNPFNLKSISNNFTSTYIWPWFNAESLLTFSCENLVSEQDKSWIIETT